MPRFSGAMPAIVTPMKADGTVDHDALRDLARWQIDEGVSGIVACGTTGEGATLAPEETVAVVRTVKEAAAGRVPVIAGTGSNDTAKSIALTKEVAALGIDGALVVTPYYNKPSPEGLYRHYEAIAREGGLPVIMYNVPGRTGLDMDADTIVRCASIDGVVAIKEAQTKMDKVVEVRERTPSDFDLLSGDDYTILPFLACGGAGVVSVVGNVAPKDTAELVNAFHNGELARARQLQHKLLPLVRALFLESNPIPVKAALAMMGKGTERYRLPLCPPTDRTRTVLADVLRTYGGLV